MADRARRSPAGEPAATPPDDLPLVWGKGDWMALALLLALATLLRAFSLGRRELWLDENYSVIMALWPAGVLRGALSDTNPPFYLYLLKGWMNLFDSGALGVRSLSALLGVVQMAALGFWLRRFTQSRRAAGWAMLLTAISPLHVYYSQEARSYTLMFLLVTLALWSFTWAIASCRWRPWGFHGLCLVLALYTHNIFIFILPAFWVAGFALRPSRRAWGRMAIVDTVAGLLYLPWFYFTMRVVRGGSLAWLAEHWDPARAWTLIPASLETLGLGGHLPGWMVSPGLALRCAAIVWLVAAVSLALWPGPEKPQTPAPSSRRAKALFLALFTLVPPGLMLLFSLLDSPIYVIGRYDTLVLPALLGLLGLGAASLHSLAERSGRGWLAGLLVAIIPLTAAAASLAPKLKPPPAGSLHHVQQMRGEVLRDAARPGDLVVCLGLEGAKIAYQMLRLEIKTPWLSYPLSTGRHLGYFLHREVVKHPEQLRADAEAILDRFATGREPGRRLWVMLDPMAFRAGPPGSEADNCTRVAQTLVDAIGRRGLVRWEDPQFLQRVNLLGILVFTAPDAAP